MFWLKFISKFIKVLKAGESPPLIACGLTMGFMIGITPFWSLQNVLLFAIAILTKVNLAAVFFAFFVFGFIAYLFDPLFHDIGYWILVSIESLKDLWATLYNTPIVPFTRFNNTVVMGSTLVVLLLAFPVYVLSKKGTIGYRTRWEEKIRNSKIVKAFRGTFIFKWYVKVRDLEF